MFFLSVYRRILLTRVTNLGMKFWLKYQEEKQFKIILKGVCVFEIQILT